jgi:lycopene beta-cyclase
MKRYDYIITGAGAAGLSLATRLLESPLRNKRVLLIERAEKNANDRTWCYWEKENGPFDSIVYRRWDALDFHSREFSHRMHIAPYAYKMIRGIDFYDHTLKRIQQNDNFSFFQGSVERIEQDERQVVVHAGTQVFHADWCFNSILFQPIDKTKVNYLDQHFKGWIIRTEHPCFDSACAVLMDFRTPQCDEARFLYVLPTDECTALVELAIFSNQLLPSEAYDTLLRRYIDQYVCPQGQRFDILHEEFGVIPMTDHPFRPSEGRVVHLGTAGGDTKASTGYTFYRIQKRISTLLSSLAETGAPQEASAGVSRKRFSLYDSALLRVIERNRLPADALFARLFQKNDPRLILAFLNEETSLSQEARILISLPWMPFIREIAAELFRAKISAPSNLPLFAAKAVSSGSTLTPRLKKTKKKEY